MEENKTSLTIRINANLKSELKALAKHYDRSLSNLVGLMLEQGLNNYVEPNPQIKNGSNPRAAPPEKMATGQANPIDLQHNKETEAERRAMQDQQHH